MTRRALVLGAGGPAACAWETGVIVGLADAGIDVRNADLFVGTSAGSQVGAQINSELTLDELFQRQVGPRRQPKELAVKVDFKKLKEDFARAKEGDGGAVDILRRVGALALAASTVSESKERKAIAAQLPLHIWPKRRLVAVAVDTVSGERRAFDGTSGVNLIDAVAASCAVPEISPAVTIEGRRYMDGGTYSTDNADLAVGFKRVLILALKPRNPAMAVVPLDMAVKTLRRNGARVQVVHPDEATEAAFAAVGGNLLDPSVQKSAARAGREQGRRIAKKVGALWSIAGDRNNSKTKQNDLQEFEQFMKRRADAARSYVSGEPALLGLMVTGIDPATFFGPWGGCVKGASKVSSRYKRDAAIFEPTGKSAFEILHMAASDGLAYWVGFQRATVRMRGTPKAVRFNLRVSEVFRREGNDWRLIHRHADSLMSKQKK
ncbi:MAG: patatin-like phospholipase family protein [Opitutaceae bacterium]